MEQLQPAVLLDMHALSPYVSLHKTAIYALIREGKFPRPLKLGGRSRWRRSDVDAFIARIAEEQGL